MPKSLFHPFIRNLRLFVCWSLCSLLLSACQQAKAEQTLAPYLNSLPVTETINASLYHYELLSEQAAEAFHAGNYLAVLKSYQTYLQAFYETELANENELLYYTGMSLKYLCALEQATPELTAFLNEHPQALRIFAITKTSAGQYQYNDLHLRKILGNRLNYPLEWNVLQEYYFKDLSSYPKTVTEQNKNVEQLYYLATHFPDMLNYAQLLNDSTLIDNSKLQRKTREQLLHIKSILAIYAKAEEFPVLASPSLVFSQPGGLIVHSRANLIRSRNFLRVAAWEPLWLIRRLKGEDDSWWWEVAYPIPASLKIQAPKGYIPSKRPVFNTIETFSGVPVTLTAATLPVTEHTPFVTSYLAASDAFYKREYFSAVEILSRLMPQVHTKARERVITLLYRTLHEIAARSTALENDYTRFVQAHPRYFNVQISSPPKLKVSNIFLEQLIATNPQSPMLQYYQPH